MDKNTFIQLAKDAYCLTLLFPSREPLRYKIREVADDIVSCFVIKDNNFLSNLKSQLELIDSFFEIASSQDWTSPARISEVREGYARAAESFPETEVKEEKRTDFIIIEDRTKNEIASPVPLGVMEQPLPQKPMIAPNAASEVEIAVPDSLENEIEEEDTDSAVLTGSQILRQNRITEFLKEKGGAQVWEIQKIFPNVSKRTIRRDFHSMLNQGLIERTGERNMTAYKIKTNLS